MRITHVFKESSKASQSMKWDFEHYDIFNTIFSAYQNPSQSKIQAFYSIKYDYEKNEGLHAVQVGREVKSLHYNKDIRVTGASSHFFSTIASFTDTETGAIWLIKETHCNTYATIYHN